MATFVRPRRQGRPKVSEMITAIFFRVSLWRASAIFFALASGFFGRRETMFSPGMLDWSMPALAQTKP